MSGLKLKKKKDAARKGKLLQKFSHMNQYVFSMFSIRLNGTDPDLLA